MYLHVLILPQPLIASHLSPLVTSQLSPLGNQLTLRRWPYFCHIGLVFTLVFESVTVA